MNNHWDNPEPHIYFCDDSNSYYYLRWVVVLDISVNELGHLTRSVKSFKTKEEAENALNTKSFN